MMDPITDDGTIQQILYPEVHLDSPIVTAKIVAYLEYAGVPHNQTLCDSTIIENIRHRKDMHFNSPLISTLSQYGRTILRELQYLRNPKHVPYPNHNKELFNLSDNSLTTKLESLFKKGKNAYNKINTPLLNCIRIIQQECGITNRLDLETTHRLLNLPSIAEQSRWFYPFLFWFTIKTEYRKVIKQSISQMRKYNKEDPVVIGNRVIVIFNHYFVTIVDKIRHEVYYLTFELVLMFCDVIEGRLQSDTAMQLDPKYHQLKPRVHLLWELIDGLFLDLGNKTYNIVALLEPLALAHLQLLDSCTSIRGAFLNHCFEELDEVLTSEGYDDPDDLRVLHDQLYEIFNPDDIHLTAELFSFFRGFGHPTLEAITAADKVRVHMHAPKVLSYEVIMKSHAIFCGIIINGYRDRHGGVWPPLELPIHASERIIQLRNNGEALSDAICVENWKSFCGIHFKCFMPLSLDSDLSMYLKDKALAALKKEWDSVYPREFMKYSPSPPSVSRRLVNVFLDDREFDPYQMIKYVIDGEYLKDEQFNLSYSLKEKEIKEVGRLFAKMTYKMRACQVIAENLISNGVGRFFKDNGMAKDEHELTKALHTLSLSSIPKDLSHNYKGGPIQHHKLKHRSGAIRKKGKHFPPERVISHNTLLDPKSNQYQINIQSYPDGNDTYETLSAFITTDLKKYCLNWRYESISVFAERLNEIYGLKDFFQWLHRILEKSVLYVSDPFCPPGFDCFTRLDDAPDDHIFIKYPMGGIEGFNQKLWTISTIPVLYLSAYETGVRISSLVQGDNQAIAVTKRVPSSWPYSYKKESVMQITVDYFKCLRTNLGWIGHNLKANETLLSSHFFVYSKGIFYDGVILSQSLKSIARCVFWSETIVDETRSACSNISTTLAKSIEKGFCRYTSYCYNIYKTILQLLIALGFTINPTMTADITRPILDNPQLLICLSILPSPIGGFNYLNMSRLFVRNIGDPITASFADLKRLIQSGLLHSSILQKVMNQQPGDSTYLDWASDPYSANLPAVQSITKIIKNITARYVLMHSPNPMLKDLFHEQSTEEDQEMAMFLLDREIIIPRAAHEILDNTVTGARESIAGLLDTTKGLIRSGLHRGGLRPTLIRKISTHDYEQYKNAIAMLHNNHFNPLISIEACSVSLAQAIRKHMWAKLTRGRPIYGLEVPDILECLKGVIITGHEQCKMCQNGSTYYGWFFVPSNCQLDSITMSTNALRVPYIGSTTEERTDMKLSYVKSPSRPLKAAVRIATVYTWAFGDDDQSWQEAWEIAKQRTNITLEELKLITPISTSTNLAHRLRDKSTQVKYSGTSLIRVSRYVNISNDQLSFCLDGRRVDTNFIYQQCMLLGLSILEEQFRNVSTTGLLNTVLHLHADVNCCITPMEDQPYIKSFHSVPDTKRIVNNRLIYDPNPIIEKEAARLSMQSHMKGLVDFVSWDTKILYHALSNSTAATLIEMITKLDKDHLSEIKAITSDDDTNSLISEMLLVNPKLFQVYLGQQACINWAYEIHFRRPKGKYEMTEIMYTLLTRSSRSIFRVFTNALSHPKVYQRFWEAGVVEPIHGPSLDTQNLVITVIDMIITSALIYLDLILNNELDDYPLMLCESDDSVVEDRIDSVQSKHLCNLVDLYCDSRNTPNIRGFPPLQKCKILSDFLHHCSQSSPSGLFWNTAPIVIDHYPCSLTYIRRGTIKQIRIRVDPGFIDVASQQLQNLDLAPVGDRINLSTQFPSSASIISWDKLSSLIKTIDKKTPLVGVSLSNYEVHAFRRIGLNSTACYKALEIIPSIRGFIDHDLPRLFLGEGAGSMLAVYQHYLGHGLVYYNSGVSSESLKSQREFNPYPSEVSLIKNRQPHIFTSNVQLLFNGRPEVTWVGNSECFNYICEAIPVGSLGLVHCDLESVDRNDPIKVLEELCQVFALYTFLGARNSALVIKLLPEKQGYITTFLKFIREHIEDQKIIIPSYSNISSTECYVVCTGLKANIKYNPNILTSRLSNISGGSDSTLLSIILEEKIKSNVLTTIGPPFIAGRPNSYLKRLTDIDKLLIAAGLEFNGVKSVKKIGHYDVHSKEQGLKSSIVSLCKELLITIDPSRVTGSSFQPYPILEMSRVRELVYAIAVKHFLYILFYDKNPQSIQKILRDLKQGLLIMDITNNTLEKYLPPFLYKSLAIKIPRKSWMFTLDASVCKDFYKVVGSSSLI
nr:MAG: RNA-dependent RNA polymerase [Wufeng rodent morbillivirus 1]